MSPEIEKRSKVQAAATPSLVSYLVGGALLGFVVGILALRDSVRAQTESVGFVWLGLFMAGGAIVGLELHRTYSWTKFGRKGRVARWVVAFASAGTAFGSLLTFRGLFGLTETLLLILFGAAIGLAVGLNSDKYFPPAPPNEEL